MAVRQYVGARYVPIFDGDYNSEKVYEPLTIVYYNNSSYTSRKTVPAGIVPTNSEYWALTGNFNGAISALTDRVEAAEDEIEAVSERYPRRRYFMPEAYGAVVNDIDVDCAPAIKAAILDANTYGGVVLLSEGNYFCSSEISISEHLSSVIITGTGRGAVGDDTNVGTGTCLWYLGSDTFIHFGGGAWQCTFEDFDIKALVTGSTAIRFSDLLGVSGARTTRCIMQRMLVEYAGIGVHCSNAAYFDIDEVFVRGGDAAILNKSGMLFDGHCEYVNVTRCRITNGVISDLSATFYNTACIRLLQGSHFYFYNVDATTADKGYDIVCDSTGQVVLSDITDCDVAYVHYGIYVTLNNSSLNGLTTNNFVYTGDSSHDTRNRVFKIEKVSGGGGYGARMKCRNTSIRVGEDTMEYWVEATTASALYAGNCEFTFNTINVPKLNYGGETRLANFGTIGQTGAVDTDLDTYNYSGFVPCRFSQNAPHSPGFDCMLLCFASGLSTVQLAIPSGANQSLAFRVYTKSNATWSAWQTLAKAA